MFQKKKREAKRPTEALMFYSNNDLFYNSYLTETLDANSIRCLHFILKKTNNTKDKFEISYSEIIDGAEISGPKYVRQSLKTLVSLGLIEVGIQKRKQTIKVLKTAKKLDTRKLK